MFVPLDVRDHQLLRWWSILRFAAPDLDPYTERYLHRALFESALGTLEPADEFTDEIQSWTDPSHLEETRAFEPHPGREWYGPQTPTSGRVWSGYLEVIDTLLAADTAYRPVANSERSCLRLKPLKNSPSPRLSVGL